jgi:ABC-type multidrug transport system fused ATPase/permease subunit
MCVLAWLHWPLCLALAALWPALYFTDRWLRDRMRGRVRAFHATFERYSQATLELLHRLDLTRMQSAEGVESSLQRERIEAVRKDGGAVAWEITVHGTGHETLGMLTGLALLLLGGVEVIRGAMTIGSLISFFFVARALNALQSQLFQLAPRVVVGQEALRSLASLLAPGNGDRLLTTPPYAAGKRPGRFDGGIQFREVTFTYPGRLPGGEAPAPVLREVSLHLLPGQTVALLGPNGAGKSTLLHLLLGFYRPTAGEILAGGEPYASLDIALLRTRFGVVPQAPIFFHGTVRENLVYGSPEAAPERVSKALERAGAAGFVEELPQCLDTVIGDDGTRLSGGQRQRLAIARALLREPALLVLDEPTTHLDRAAVDTLVETLGEIVPRPAVLIVSHDHSLIDRCQVDHTYELRAGRLAART